ncbi:MAG: serine/threonine kinase, partial [Spirochaetes bacterium]
PKREDIPERRVFKIIGLLAAGIIFAMIVSGVVAFFLVFEGREEIMVPDVTGKELAQALLSLQERGLNARIQLRFSANPQDKGIVMGQDPRGGTLTKVGDRVVLSVSRGAVIDRVEDYIGWDLNDLEIHLQTLFTTYGPLIQIKRPVVRVFDEAAPGTILEQKPEPGTPISGPVELELVVSRGSEEENVIVENYVGMDFRSALNRLVSINMPFVFQSRKAERGERPGFVVSQSPSPDSIVSPNSLIQLVMTEPENLPENRVFGILRRTLPDYPIMVDLHLYALSFQGEREELLSMKHPGGLISIPYIVEENTTLVLSVFNREIIRYTVEPEEEELE